RDSPLASKDRANSSTDSRLRRAQLLGLIPLLEHARARQGRVVLLDAYQASTLSFSYWRLQNLIAVAIAE
ncbi:MAG TPA: hypothetical protein VNF74_01800, partial [Terriglobales bacterium]|nr:hypothetical protein [Terriglobales bacterium]